MSSDILLKDDEVEIVEADLNVSGSDGDRGDVQAKNVNADAVNGETVSGDQIEGREATLGVESPAELTASGKLRIVDDEGEGTITLQGSGGRIYAGKVITDELYTDTTETDEITLGDVHAQEVPSPGKMNVSDDNGEVSIQLDGKNGSIHFDGGDGGGGNKTPFIYAFTDPEGGEEDDDSDSVEDVEQPLIGYSTSVPQRGISYRTGEDKILFQNQEFRPAITGGGGGGNWGIGGGGVNIPEQSFEPTPVLTVDLENQRVGIGTDDPKHDLHVEGTAKANEWSRLSDARCKSNVQTIDDPTETVTQLRGVSYDWDDDAEFEFDDERHVGFLGQEIEEVLPEVVSVDEDGYRSVNESALTAVLVEAFKDQQATVEEQAETIDEQAERIEDLESRLADLESRLN